MLTRRAFLIGSAALGLSNLLRRCDMARYFGSPAPSGPNVFLLTTAPEGGWSWFEDPRAVANGAYTYIGYNQGGNLKIAVSLAGVPQATVTVASGFEYDDHDTPTMRVRADGKLIVFYSKHVGPNIYKRISTNTLGSDPTLSGGFAAAVSLSAGLGASASTYPSPTYLSAPDGGSARLFLGWRETVAGVNQFWYATSTDDGDTWGGHVALHTVTYTKTAPNGTGRWDIACSDHGSVATKIYHAYRATAAWHQSDGTTISATLPFAGSAMTTVYDGGTDHVWINDVAVDGSGNPVVAFTTWPSNDYTDARYMYALWNGASWSVNQIAVGGTWIPDTVEYPPGTFQYQYAGGVILDHADPQIVYASIGLGSNLWQIKKFVTANGGSSFATTTVSNASAKNVRPISVRDAADVVVAWLNGTYTDYVDYSQGIVGYIP